MAAFGLEETGHYGEALEAGRAAVAANPDDVWAIHAVVHTYEMQGRIDEGIAFLRSDETRWESGNLFTVHNWWHLALYELEAGRPERALAIYDAEVHHAGSLGVPIEMIDASALLWRLRLEDADTGGRFGPLADAWAAKSDAAPWYAFNDLHAVMAFAGAGRLADARELVARLAAWLPAAVRLERRDDGRDRPADVPRRHRLRRGPPRRRRRRAAPDPSRAGSTSAARTPSATRCSARCWSRRCAAGATDLANALVAERLGVRETSVYGWTQRARALRGLADEPGAVAAEATAAAHRERFRVA